MYAAPVRLSRSQRRTIQKYRRFLATNAGFLMLARLTAPTQMYSLVGCGERGRQGRVRIDLDPLDPHNPDLDPYRPREGEGARQADGEGRVRIETAPPGQMPLFDITDCFYPI